MNFTHCRRKAFPSSKLQLAANRQGINDPTWECSSIIAGHPSGISSNFIKCLFKWHTLAFHALTVRRRETVKGRHHPDEAAITLIPWPSSHVSGEGKQANVRAKSHPLCFVPKEAARLSKAGNDENDQRALSNWPSERYEARSVQSGTRDAFVGRAQGRGPRSVRGRVGHWYRWAD